MKPQNRVPVRAIELFHGRHKRLELKVRWPNGQDLDLNGATIEFAMARTAGGNAVLSVPGTVPNPDQGIGQVDILDTDLDPLPNKDGEFYYEVVVTDSAGREGPVVRGPVIWNAGVVTT